MQSSHPSLSVSNFKSEKANQSDLRFFVNNPSERYLVRAANSAGHLMILRNNGAAIDYLSLKISDSTGYEAISAVWKAKKAAEAAPEKWWQENVRRGQLSKRIKPEPNFLSLAEIEKLRPGMRVTHTFTDAGIKPVVDWGEKPIDLNEKRREKAARTTTLAPGAGNPQRIPDQPKRPIPFSPSAAAWRNVEPSPIPFAIESLFPLGFVSLLVSAGGRGKSTAAQQAMTCIASGKDFLGFKTERGAAAGIFCEDADNTLHKRQREICTALSIAFDEVADDLSPMSYVGVDALLWTEKGEATRLLADLERDLEGRPDLKLLVLDGTSFVFGASEFERGPVTRFMAALTGLAQRLKIAVVLITHESKSSKDDDIHAASGSTAWINSARSVVKLNDEGDDRRTFVHIKANLSKRVPSIPCSLSSGAFIPLNIDTRRRDDCRSATERLMRAALQSGESLSPNRMANNYAPRWLAANQGATDFVEAEFDQAVSDLNGFVFEIANINSKGKVVARFQLVTAADALPTLPVSDASDASPTLS